MVFAAATLILFGCSSQSDGAAEPTAANSPTQPINNDADGGTVTSVTTTSETETFETETFETETFERVTSEPAAPVTTETTQPPALADVLRERALPETGTDLAKELSEVEAAVRDPAMNSEEVLAWGQRQQRLYRLLASNPDWADATLTGVRTDVMFAVEQNWAARKALSSLVRSGPLASVLPAWQLREPLPSSELLGYYKEAEAQTGIAWNYLAAINLVETRMGRIEGFSTAGATGPMQFLPSTWAECCEGDPTIDRDAIIGAGVYLALVGGTQDLPGALYRYNNSDRYVDAVTAYANVLAEDELSYRGYHAWQVYFLSSAGLLQLPADYYQPEPIPVEEWLVGHPDALLD